MEHIGRRRACERMCIQVYAYVRILLVYMCINVHDARGHRTAPCLKEHIHTFHSSVSIEGGMSEENELEETISMS